MRKILIFSLLALSFNLFATDWVKINQNKNESTTVNILSYNQNDIIVKVSVNAFKLLNVNTENSDVLFSPNTSRIMKKGAPDLPKISKSFIIPDNKDMEFEIVSSDFIDYYDVNIAPSKGNLLRNVNPSDIPFEYGIEYQKDEFYPNTLASINDPYILRDFRGQSVWFYPYQYNPVQKVLRIYTDITIKLSNTKKAEKNIFVRDKSVSKFSNQFLEIYKRNFINFSTHKYTPIEEEGNILVICPTSYMSTIQPYVDWKTLKGISTDLVDLATIGNNATSIKNFVTDYYNNKGLTYLLLVGDGAQLVPMNKSGDSDAAYGHIVGTDSYAEVFVGRFSAENVSQLQTQVDRSVNYEKNPQQGADWYRKFSLIASSEGPGDDNEYDYLHMQNIKPDLLGYTYLSGDEFYDGSQGGNDAAGNPTPAILFAAFNEGRGNINYVGHGDTQMWVTSGFNNANINSLTNHNKLPFIFDVACVNGDFKNNTCFAEAWVRATNNNLPTGAVAIIASTINQSWAPPMVAQDEMIDILTESYTSNIKRTFAGIAINGCMLMNDETSDFAMTDTWTIFGDPSLMVRTNTPIAMTVSHPSTVFIGASSVNINCDVEGAYVSLTIDGDIIGTGYISGGSTNISFNQLTNVGVINVCVTAYNTIPYFGEIQIVPNAGPYVVYNSKIINDAILGNANGNADTDEQLKLGVKVSNVGTVTAQNVTLSLSSSDSYVTIIDNNEVYGNINANDTVTVTDAFELKFANNTPDQRNINFTLEIKDINDSIWISYFSIKVNAPDLALSLFNIDDATGNNNNKLDAGENVNLIFKSSNNGQFEAANTICNISCNSPYITINSNSVNLNTIASSSFANASFPITVSQSAPLATVANFIVTLTSGQYTKVLNLPLTIGLIVEDWESNSFSSYPWTTAGNAPWIITSGTVYEGAFAAVSGDISPSSWGQPDNTSELMVTLNVLANDTISFYRKVSSEADYDFLKFFIDNVEKDAWSGELDWELFSYPVTAGTRTFKWVYSEDYYLSVGQDCGWIDYVILPANDYSTFIYKTNNESKYSLEIYPNPGTCNNLELGLENDCFVDLKLYDITGKLVTVILNENMKKGQYNLNIFNNLDNGIYTYVLKTNNSIITKRIILNK